MDATDIVLLGLVWAQFRRPEAGIQLIDAIESDDPEIVSLAAAMLEQEGLCSKELVNEAMSRCSHSSNLEHGSTLAFRETLHKRSPAISGGCRQHPHSFLLRDKCFDSYRYNHTFSCLSLKICRSAKSKLAPMP